MKTPILHSTIAAAYCGAALCTFAPPAAHAAEDIRDERGRQYREQIERIEAKPDAAEKNAQFHIQKPGHGTNAASSSVTTSSDGTATITMEVNGKKETRTFNLNGERPFTVTLKDAHEPGKKRTPGEKETWIGIGVGASISEEVRAQLPLQPGEGVTVLHVAAESPAAKAGLAQHDILVRLEDQVLVNSDQFKKLIRMRKPGETVKVGYLRKGERKEASVVLGEHEAEFEAEDVLKLVTEPERIFKGISGEKWEDRLKGLREKSGVLRERLKEAKDKFPGMIVDKQAFVLGVDGTVKKLEGELQNIEGAMRALRDHLEKADIPKETVEEVRIAVEGAIEKAGQAVGKAALEAIREYRGDDGVKKTPSEPPKLEAPAQPAPPVPPIKTPQ